MSEITELLADLLDYSPIERNEGANLAFLSPKENGVDTGILAQLAPLAPSPPVFENSHNPELRLVSLPYVLDQSDDRILCSDCSHLSRSGYCGKWGIVNPANKKYRPVVDTLRRCGSFSLKYTATD